MTGMLINRFFILATLGFVVLGSTRVYARVFYVSIERGDNAADGGTPETAFRTLERAVSRVRGGDTLKVLPGEYYVAPLTIRDLGSSIDNPVWIVGEPRGRAVLSAAWREAALGQVAWEDEGEGVWSAAHGTLSRRESKEL
jgi:hypothetical protein